MVKGMCSSPSAFLSSSSPTASLSSQNVQSQSEIPSDAPQYGQLIVVEASRAPKPLNVDVAVPDHQ